MIGIVVIANVGTVVTAATAMIAEVVVVSVAVSAEAGAVAGAVALWLVDPVDVVVAIAAVPVVAPAGAGAVAHGTTTVTVAMRVTVRTTAATNVSRMMRHRMRKRKKRRWQFKDVPRREELLWIVTKNKRVCYERGRSQIKKMSRVDFFFPWRQISVAQTYIKKKEDAIAHCVCVYGYVGLY